MAQENWWDAYPDAPAQSGPLASPTKEPPAPKTTYRTLLPDEAAAEGLLPGKTYQKSSEGKIDALPGAGEKSATQMEIENKAESQIKRANTIRSIMGEVRKLYVQDIKGQPVSRLFGATEYIDALPDNERFTASGNNILPLIRPLIAQTAKEGDSNQEMTIFQSYVPTANDSDQTIEQKMKMLEILIGGMIDGQAPSQALAAAQGNDSSQPPAAGTTGASPPPAPPPAGGPPPANALEAGNIPGADDGTGETLLAAGQAEKTVTDAGLNNAYRQRLGEGASGDELVALLTSAGINDPKAHQQARAQASWRARFPKVPIEKYPVNFTFTGKVAGSEQALNSLAQTDVGAAAISAGDAASGFTLDNIVGATGGNAERTRMGVDQVAEDHPKSSLAGTVVGGTIGALGLQRAAGAAGVTGVRGMMLGDAAYGAGAGAGMTDYAADGSAATVADRMLGAGKGTAIGVAGSYLGNKVGAGGAKLATGTSNPSVRAMQDVGAVTTIGQQLGQSGKIGGAIKSAEDRLSGVPVVGDMIKSRQTEGFEKMNAGAFDRALKPIGKSVNGKTGEEAMLAADQEVSAAFTQALRGKRAPADPQFETDLGVAVFRAMDLPRVGPEVADEIKAIIQPYMSGNGITGEAMQQMSRDLRAYKSKWANDTASRRVGEAIDGVEEAIFGMFRRHTPEVLPAYNKAKLAAQRLYTIERAVLKGKNTDGVFTPAQLGQADREATIAYGGRRAASTGRGQFHDYQRAAQNVLPNKIPDSGTAGRLAMLATPAAIAGSGAGVGYAAGDPSSGAGAGLTLATILTLAYTKGGQRLLTKPGRGMSGRTGRVLKSETTRKALTASGAASGVALANQQ